ncbi:glutaredoxin [Cristinia sonorae]|uniref:Glutaredoxin n=1 Tax=Cristinia sonorae TaxID=1940300 RepID=A0A8K0XMT1_9AGAR|nr:glutaredoxin [Cristinia sonorae]
MAATSPNFHVVTSAEHFKALLSEDLNRVSLINFWAPWAGPCQQMNKVVIELAKQNPALLVLQVEAEEQEDIAESFDINSVPSFLILRGHTLLSRIDGADATKLTSDVATHVRPPAPAPQSVTTQKPAPAGEEVEKTETPEELNARLQGLLKLDKVVLFMKGEPDAPRCGFSRKIVGILRDQKVDFTHFDILSDESVRSGMKILNNWPTFPQLIINGEFVGGLDIVQEMVENGELREMLEA